MPLKATMVSEEPDKENFDQQAWPSRKQANRFKTITTKPGIVIKCMGQYRGQDTNEKIFINCVGHDAIELPQFNQNPVDQDYLDRKGVEGLRVPLLVGQPRQVTDHAGEIATAVDVVFNTWVVDRCLKASESAQGIYGVKYFRMRISEIALKFVRDETGLVIGRTYNVLKNTKYKGEDGQKTRPFELPRDVREDLEATYNRTKAEHDAKQREAGPAPMVQEIDPADATPTELKPNAKNKVKAAKGKAASKMNNGFFDKAGDKAVLYPDGSNEGVQHEDAGNPLGWMPKKLRSMVQVVDPAVTSEQDQYKMMEEYARTGKNPNAPPPSEDKNPMSEKNIREHVAKMKADEEAKERKARQLAADQKAAAAAAAKKAAEDAASKEARERLANAIGAAEAIAAGATDAFKAKDYASAATGWGEALACLRAAKVPSTNEQTRTAKIGWHNNRAAALLQLKRYDEAESAATEVLGIESGNLKALYRRGTARLGVADTAATPNRAQIKLQESVLDFEAVIAASPENGKAAKDLAKAKAKLDSSVAAAQAEREAKEIAEAEAARAAEAAKAEVAKSAEIAAAAKRAALTAEEQETARKAAEKAYWDEKMAAMSSKDNAAGQVEEYDSDADSAVDVEEASITPKHTVKTGSTDHELVVTVELPTVKRLKGFDIAVSDDGDELKVVGAGYALILPLKSEIDVDSVRAKFDKTTRVLTIKAEEFEDIATSKMR